MVEEQNEKRNQIQRANREIEITSGTLVGAGIIAIVQTLSVTSLDIPLKVSICSFAISIPSLTMVFLTAQAEHRFASRSNKRLLRRMVDIFSVTGHLTSLIGIGALFFHFTNYAGLIFTAACLIAFSAWALYLGDIDPAHRS